MNRRLGEQPTDFERAMEDAIDGADWSRAAQTYRDNMEFLRIHDPEAYAEAVAFHDLAEQSDGVQTEELQSINSWTQNTVDKIQEQLDLEQSWIDRQDAQHAEALRELSQIREDTHEMNLREAEKRLAGTTSEFGILSGIFSSDADRPDGSSPLSRYLAGQQGQNLLGRHSANYAATNAPAPDAVLPNLQLAGGGYVTGEEALSVLQSGQGLNIQAGQDNLLEIIVEELRELNSKTARGLGGL